MGLFETLLGALVRLICGPQQQQGQQPSEAYKPEVAPPHRPPQQYQQQQQQGYGAQREYSPYPPMHSREQSVPLYAPEPSPTPTPTTPDLRGGGGAPMLNSADPPLPEPLPPNVKEGALVTGD